MSDLLYGNNPQENIVAIDVWANDVYEYIQDSSGKVYEHIVNGYEPWYFSHTENPNLKGSNFFNTVHRIKKLKDILIKFELPFEADLEASELIKTILIDKKFLKNTLNLIVLKDIGQGQIVKLSADEILKKLKG